MINLQKYIKVLIVDDSRTACNLLTHIIESDPEFKVVGNAENGEQAIQWLQEHSCDIITMDIQMPGLNGFEVIQLIMESDPHPTVIISSGYTSTDEVLAFRAMEVGALAILEKPTGPFDENYSRKTSEIINTLKEVSGLKLMTNFRKKKFKEMRSLVPEIKSQTGIQAVGIGASLGGPLAIAQILEKIPASFPVPILIVQHIAAGFTEEFVRWLKEKSKLQIFLAKDGINAMPGCVYIAPDSCQMEMKHGNLISLDYSTKPSIQPSIGRLFKSMANTYGSHCVGVVLTGMGRDGAAELLTLKQKGAYTIAQDEASCLMFGIPKEAIALGAVSKVLPLNMIPSTLIDLVKKNDK